MTRNFCGLFRSSKSSTQFHPGPNRGYQSFGSTTTDQDEKSFVESASPPIATPPMTTPMTEIQNPSHILELPSEVRAQYLALFHGKILTINQNTASNIFGNLGSSADRELLNKVETIIINDLEGAKALATALDNDYLFRHSQGVISTCDHPSASILKIVSSISFGSSIIESIVSSSSLEYLHIHKILQAIGFMKNGNLKSYTAHGFWLYRSDCIPTSLESINIVFPDCPAATLHGEFCTCSDHCNILDFIVDMDIGQVDKELRGIRLHLINLPHICAPRITVDSLAELKIDSEGGEPVINEDGKVIDIRKTFKECSGWVENNFKVVDKDVERPCICCGKV
ncbi:hypothetical protein I302_100100 [Kwoniella bestiolae CBS 10118]|uniref:Uncharacterized protein n=1 Tax=Kwoniella bestiolae CBS 10118 TaxID=1296100 RepID=A0A1B9G467_9TREE|nr:hypothetical protein I302_03474 [Kwoniella bestiolae CBS 10118]OCF25801.1 hypothetical protein I302_03474 [Kwoniella bestiolae CBS 10118]